MEIIGIVLLLAMFGLGLGFVYLFLQFVELMKSIKVLTENIDARLAKLEARATESRPAGPAEPAAK